MRATISVRQLAAELTERLPLRLVLVLGVDLPSSGVIARLDAELTRLSVDHQTHELEDTAVDLVRACSEAPEKIHLVRVRDPLPAAVWHQLTRRRSVLQRAAAVVFALSLEAVSSLKREAPDVDSLLRLTTFRVAHHYRVIVWPLRTEERALALEAMRTSGSVRHDDEGVVLGELDEETIHALEARGVVMEVFDPVVASATVVEPAPARWPARSVIEADRYAFLLLQHGEAPGTEVLEREDADRYKVRIQNHDAWNLLFGIPGVRRAREIVLRSRRISSPFESLQPPTPWVVFLYREADRDAVVARIEAVGVRVLTVSGRAVRIEAREDFCVEIAQWDEVRRVETYTVPELSADIYRVQVGLCVRGADGALRDTLPWDGRDEVVAMADSGIDGTHPELEGVILETIALGRPGDPSDTQGHGTHVAGILAGRGRRFPQYRGVAPGARLIVQSIVDAEGRLGGLPDDLALLLQAAYDRGARIHNDSWGASVEGRYDLRAEQMDEFVCEHRDMLIVVAAGNRGTALKPQGRSPSAPDGFVEYASIDAPAVAKNVLTVGACRSARDEGGRARQTWGTHWAERFPRDPIASQRISGDAEAMAATSSRGPVEGTRIKPDLVAPGTDIISTWPRSLDGGDSWGLVAGTEKAYRYLGGTSMATPIVAGCAARVRQYFREVHRHHPSAALLKATLLNGARPLTADDAVHGARPPNFHQGFGCIDMTRTIPAPDGSFALAFDDRWQTPAEWLPRTGAQRRFRVDVIARGELRVCLVWTEPPRRGRQHDLQLYVELPDGTRQTGNARRAGSIPEQPEDRVNNALALRIADASEGTYTLTVKAEMLLGAPQDFALVVTGALGETQNLTR
jgi:subtilisin family serine protease